MIYHEKLKSFWKAVSSEESRYVLQAVMVDVAKKVIVATDGHMLSILSIADMIEADDKESFLVPVDALKAAHKMYNRRARRDNLKVFIRASKEEIAVTQQGTRTTHIYDKPRGQYPQWEAVVTPAKEFTAQFSLSTSLLTRLVDSMRGEDGFDGVILSVTKASKAIYITKAMDGRDSLGVLMPMRFEPIPPCKFWSAATKTKKEAKAEPQAAEEANA